MNENPTASGGDMFGPGTLMEDPLVVAERASDDVALNDWRLDVSGVQVRRSKWACGGIDRALE